MKAVFLLAVLVAAPVLAAEQTIVITNEDGNNSATLTCSSDRPVCMLKGDRIEAEFGLGLAAVYKAAWHDSLLESIKAEEPFAYIKTFNHAGSWCATIMMDFSEENYYINLETMAHGPQQWICSGE